jgi:TonB family protein
MNASRSPRAARADYIARMSLSQLRPTATFGVLAMIALVGVMACMDSDTTQKVAQAFQASTSMPDEVPKMINTELPFRYPAALYARRVQGNVTLRLHVDRDGQVRADSTRIEESSGYPALDSAAILGSQALRFVPAKLHGEPMAVTILFPVYFRHPDAHPLPGDTILTRHDSTPTEGP